MAEDAIVWSGKFYNIACPHKGESALGRNWSETHQILEDSKEAEAIMVGSLTNGFAFARIKHGVKVRQLKRDNKQDI